MQQRVHVSYHDTFLSALAAKKEAADKAPNINFQIRKRPDRFELVKRVSVNAVKNTEVPQEDYTKRRKPRRLWKKSADAQPFNYEYNNRTKRMNRLLNP